MAHWREDSVGRRVQSVDEMGSFLVTRTCSGSSNGRLLRLLRWKTRKSSTDILFSFSSGRKGGVPCRTAKKSCPLA